MPLPEIDEIFNKLGPTPRLCFNTDWTKYQRELNRALGKLSLAYLENLASCEPLELDAVSHKLFMLRRSSIDEVDSEEEMQPISPFVRSKIAIRMRALKRHELVSLFNRYNALPSTRKMTGDVFEAYCHIVFSTKIKFDFVKMVRIGGQPTAREKMMAQWFSSHSEFTSGPQSQKLNVLRSSALDSGVSLDVGPSRIVEYDSNEIAGGLQIEADVYYIPITTTQVGIDSFIMHDEILYLLQMTVSGTHDISDGLWPFLKSLKGLPPKRNWRFIFLKPPAKRLACPVPHSAELLDLDLYSAEIKVM